MVSRVTIVEPLRLDILAKEKMGTERDGALEALLDANPGLADGGPFVITPRDIVVPETPEPPAAPAVNPWE